MPRIISSSGAGTLRNDDAVGPGPAPSIQLRRVGESVYLVSFPEGRDVPAHALDDTGEVVAEDDRKLVFCRREQTAQRDGSVDAVHGGRADAYEQLVRTRLRDPAACGDGPAIGALKSDPRTGTPFLASSDGVAFAHQGNCCGRGATGASELTGQGSSGRETIESPKPVVLALLEEPDHGEEAAR